MIRVFHQLARGSSARCFIRGGTLAEGVPNCSRIRFSSVSSSSPDDLVTTSLDTATGVATVTMNNAPVNSLSMEMCKALSASIKQAEKERSIQSLILTSFNPSIFSAGLDLTEMHKPDMKRLIMFWSSFQDLYLDLYGSRLACIAAMQGHAPAAGCMLALSCDYRIMSETSEKHRPTIGLNETKLGIVAPPWLGQQMVDTVGRRNGELSLSLGTLYSPEEALKIGLVDLVVPQDQVEAKASEAALQWAKIPPQARVASKRMIRKDRLDRLKASRSQDVEHFANFVTTEKVQDNLTAYLEMLAKKSKKK